MMIRMMIMSLIFFVSSCQSVPQISPKISCDIKLKEENNGLYSGRCLCRCLDLNRIDSPLLDFSMCDNRYAGDDVAFNLMACNQIVGFKLKTYAEEIRPWLIESVEYCQDLSN